MDKLQLGPLQITFHRTVRVSLEQTSNLPPSLGVFELYKVSDYRETCPKTWEDSAYFLAMHDKEALWMNFDCYSRENTPVALLVGCGGINALTGEKLGLTLQPDNYLVTPPQPWLDGWKDKDGTVYQFVTTAYKAGDGLTVAEQILGEESKSGGIGIAVFEAKNPENLVAQQKPIEGWSDSSSGSLEFCSLECSKAAYATEEMGVGKGGKITQKVYEDPYGLEVWKEEPSDKMAIYLVNAEQFSQITGKPMPPLPRVFEDYIGKWYGLKDEHLADVAGTDKYTNLKTAFSTFSEEQKEKNV